MPVPNHIQAEEATSEAAGTLASAAYRQLRRDIIAAEFPAGSRLHTRQLCQRYQVGLSPIREALSRLSSEGLVRRSDQRGFSVAPLSEADLDDLTRSRCWLNQTGLRESIQHGDAAWEEGVVIAFHRLARVPRFLKQGTLRNPAWEDAHRAFHAALVGGCRSEWLIGFCQLLYDAFERYRNLSPFGAKVRPQHVVEHRAITDAAVMRDADTACRLLQTHFETSAALVRKHLAAPRSRARREIQDAS